MGRARLFCLSKRAITDSPERSGSIEKRQMQESSNGDDQWIDIHLVRTKSVGKIGFGIKRRVKSVVRVGQIYLQGIRNRVFSSFFFKNINKYIGKFC